jgi:hypothetical protein
MAIAQTALANSTEPPNMALVRLYKQAALELKELATQRLVRDARTLTAEAKRARLLEREVSQILQELDQSTAQWIAENIPKSYLTGVRQAELGFKEIGLTTTGTLDPLIHQDAIQVLVNDLQDTMLDATERVSRGYRDFVKRTQLRARADQKITEKTAETIATGRARRDASKQIRQILVDEYGSRPLRIGGKNYNLWTW